MIKTPNLYYLIKKQRTVKEKEITKIETYFEKKYFEVKKTDVKVEIKLDQRKKGVLWFPTFKLRYVGQYEFDISNSKKGDEAIHGNKEKIYFYATLDSSESLYHNIALSINKKKYANVLPLVKKESVLISPFIKNNKATIELSYECTGMNQFDYLITPVQEDIELIKQFVMQVDADFDNFNFVDRTLSPLEKVKTKNGWSLKWDLNNAVTGKDIGLIIPNKLNPGDIVSRVTFFAPVSLFFFFFCMIVISIIKKINIHPVNYFFLAASFFSFHLMYAYFSDHLNIYLTFGIASIVSLFLTSSYLRLLTPKFFYALAAPSAQFIYLVVFSFSFFYKGMTGLIVTIFSVITLFVMMQMTGKLNWDDVFNKNK